MQAYHNGKAVVVQCAIFWYQARCIFGSSKLKVREDVFHLLLGLHNSWQLRKCWNCSRCNFKWVTSNYAVKKAYTTDMSDSIEGGTGIDFLEGIDIELTICESLALMSKL